MKLLHTVLVLLISIGMLSGCAYIQGRKDQAAADNASVRTKTLPHSKNAGITLSVQGGNQAQAQAEETNASSTASKMIAPFVQ